MYRIYRFWILAFLLTTFKERFFCVKCCAMHCINLQIASLILHNICYKEHAHNKNLNIIKNNVNQAVQNETNKTKNRPPQLVLCVTYNEIKKVWNSFFNFFSKGPYVYYAIFRFRHMLSRYLSGGKWKGGGGLQENWEHSLCRCMV